MTFDAIHALDANAAHQYQSKHHTARHDEHMQTVLFRCGITARRMQRLESLHRPTSDETHAGEEAQYHHRDARLRGTGHISREVRNANGSTSEARASSVMTPNSTVTAKSA